jgi:hypothetical protein
MARWLCSAQDQRRCGDSQRSHDCQAASSATFTSFCSMCPSCAARSWCSRSTWPRITAIGSFSCCSSCTMSTWPQRSSSTCPRAHARATRPVRSPCHSTYNADPPLLGLTMVGCVYSRTGEPLPACFPSSRQRRAANGKKFALKIMTTVCTSLLRCSQNFSGVHIVSPVFTSFLSPLDYTCVSKGIYTHASTLGHITMPLHATHHR